MERIENVYDLNPQVCLYILLMPPKTVDHTISKKIDFHFRKILSSMNRHVSIGNRPVGTDHPCYTIAEIGINHNGDIDIVKALIDAAVSAKFDAVKFQKRTPSLCVPADQQHVERETPWGTMTYLDYRYRVELNEADYREIDRYCNEKGIVWFASCWDNPSVDFIEKFDPVCYKIPSAMLTNDRLLLHIKSKDRPVILSTGMSTMEQIRHAVSLLDTNKLLIAHSTSTYPCEPHELNLKMIETLMSEFPCVIGYSGHETELQTTYAAVAIGAKFVERHITLDRLMWGTDQKSSLEPNDLIQLVRDIRIIEKSFGDGVKTVYDSEKAALKKLRGQIDS